MRILSLLVLLLLAFGQLVAQADSLMPLQGKTVAVYFSRKQFSFDDHYRIPLSQFVMSDKGTEINIEDLKSETLIALGALFSKQLGAVTEADSVYFLNEYPELANAFIQAYRPDSQEMDPVLAPFLGTDYVLVVSPLVLSSYKVPTVYSRSNRLITEYVAVKNGHVQLSVFNPANGRRLYWFEACMDERGTVVPKVLFEFHMQNSQTGQFLARLFSLVVGNMNLGVEGNCAE